MTLPGLMKHVRAQLGAALAVGIAVLVATVLRRASAGDEPRAQA